MLEHRQALPGIFLLVFVNRISLVRYNMMQQTAAIAAEQTEREKMSTKKSSAKKSEKEASSEKKTESAIEIKVAKAMNEVMGLEPPIETNSVEKAKAGVDDNLKEVAEDDFGDEEGKFSGKVAEYLKAAIAARDLEKASKTTAKKPAKEKLPKAPSGPRSKYGHRGKPQMLIDAEIEKVEGTAKHLSVKELSERLSIRESLVKAHLDKMVGRGIKVKVSA